MANRRKSQEFEVVVVYDENGPTFNELMKSPEVIAWFEGVMITRKFLKPELRQKYLKKDVQHMPSVV